MAASRLAQRESHSNVIAALRLLTRVLPLPASRALHWHCCVALNPSISGWRST